MRPRGEVRQALGNSAWELARERTQGVAWKQIAAHAQVGWTAGRRTIENMARAGELVKVGQVRMAGSCRPLNAYLPAAVVDQRMAEITDRTVALTNAVNAWAGIRSKR